MQLNALVQTTKLTITKRLKAKQSAIVKKLEMLTGLTAGQRDGRHRQADDDFRGWVKSVVLLLAVNGPKFIKFGDDIEDPSYTVNRKKHTKTFFDIQPTKPD